MILIYRPDGVEQQRWTIALGRIRSGEAEDIERVTGQDFGTGYKQALLQGNMRARRALLWVMLRRQHTSIKFSDVDFADDEVELTMDRDEWAEMRKATEEAPEIDEATRAQALAAIDAAIAEAEPAPGKAPSSSDDAATPSP